MKTFEYCSLHYCSLHYLNMWLDNDSYYHQALCKNNAEQEKLTALKNAGNSYKVARTLPTKYDEGINILRYKPILDIINPLTIKNFENKDNSEVANTVIEIERQLSEKYGNRNVLSATTKFLWIKFRKPIIIYDSRARKALSLNTLDNDYYNYNDYYEKWKNEFEINKESIVEVCSKLTDVAMYATKPDKNYIEKISKEEWFYERVFDIYLWNKGG